NVPQTTSTGLIAPISGQSVGLQRAQVTHGVRQLILCKDKDGKVGVRVKAINKGVFVSVVVENSPAAMAGLRFGDQILQINDENVAGYTMEKVHAMFKKSPVNGIKVVVRDRPFERTITLHKDSVGCIGFQYKNGKIITIVKDSSAARNGVLIEHQLLEVDGQNVVGLKDKEITNIIQKAGTVVTITVIPSFLYEHMIKSMKGSLLKDLMDHSIPTL
ncbi:syntenin-1-like, partial [Diabrotica undecimpunctata]|uniref:syntenin-1-like n=1 Tax=Diabrotica undecimpunctata TaxID=50387 RepID=UPI003B634186